MNQLTKACNALKQANNIVIISHIRPDGDTLGSAFALLFTLEKMGKTARVECADPFPKKYEVIFGGYQPKEFDAQFVVTVDVASLTLLGDLADVYGDRIDLCIDHHISNNIPAKQHLIDTTAPAATQVIADVVEGLGIAPDQYIANAIFTGLATDTGCFKYDNVTPKTHRCAADMIEAGAQHGKINKIMFDTISRGRIEVEKQIISTLEYHYNGEIALVVIPDGLTKKHHVSDEELDGISAFPRKIEGVRAGITMREKGDGKYRISVRSGDGVNASAICGALGGGGHKNAAGCTIEGTLELAKEAILREVGKELQRHD